MEDHIKQIRAGDFVLLDGDLAGRVAFSSISQSYSIEYPQSEWVQTEGTDGIMIVQNNGARVFFDRSFFEDGEVQIQVVEEQSIGNYGTDLPKLEP
jgi:hypothetical protein